MALADGAQRFFVGARAAVLLVAARVRLRGVVGGGGFVVEGIHTHKYAKVVAEVECCSSIQYLRVLSARAPARWRPGPSAPARRLPVPLRPGSAWAAPSPMRPSRTGSPPPGSPPARAYASFGVRATMPVASIPTMRSSYTHVGVAMPESSSDPTTPPADMSISAFFLSGSTPCWTKSTESP